MDPGGWEGAGAKEGGARPGRTAWGPAQARASKTPGASKACDVWRPAFCSLSRMRRLPGGLACGGPAGRHSQMWSPTYRIESPVTPSAFSTSGAAAAQASQRGRGQRVGACGCMQRRASPLPCKGERTARAPTSGQPTQATSRRAAHPTGAAAVDAAALERVGGAHEAVLGDHLVQRHAVHKEVGLAGVDDDLGGAGGRRRQRGVRQRGVRQLRTGSAAATDVRVISNREAKDRVPGLRFSGAWQQATQGGAAPAALTMSNRSRQVWSWGRKQSYA